MPVYLGSNKVNIRGGISTSTEGTSSLQEKYVVMSSSPLNITPDEGYAGLSSVTVIADIPLSVKSITTTGSYDTATYHGEYYAAISGNNLLLIVQGGTSTSYESIMFSLTAAPTDVTLVNQSYYSYSSTSASKYYCAIFNNITSDVALSLDFNAINSSSDYTTCAVTITAI